MTTLPAEHSAILIDIRRLIDDARERAAVAVNAELTLLYWHVGRRIKTEVLKGQRAGYGKQIVATLARHLTAEYGKGWSEQQLRHCLRAAETFTDETILSTQWRESGEVLEAKLHRSIEIARQRLAMAEGEEL